MNTRAALVIALAIVLAGLYVGDSIRSLRSLHVDMVTKVQIVDRADGHGAP